MSAALLALAGALLCWPARVRSPARRLRRARRFARPGPPTAGAAACLGLLLGASVSTPVVAGLLAAASFAAVRARSARTAGRDVQDQVRALAEGLGVLAAELRAGRPLDPAAGTAVAGCPHPVAAAALLPVLHGGSAPPGLPAEARSALDRVVAARAVSARTGCSLAAAVGAAEDDLRARLRTRAELSAALAGPRASATVLAGLPVLGLLMGAGIGADPWTVLTTTPVGTALLLAGVGLEAAGLVWTGRLTERAARA